MRFFLFIVGSVIGACVVLAQPLPTDHYEIGMFRPPATAPFSITVYPLDRVMCGRLPSDQPPDAIPNPTRLELDDPAAAGKVCRMDITAPVLALPVGTGYTVASRTVAANGISSAWVFYGLTFRRAPRGLPCAGGSGVEMSVGVDVNGKPATVTLCLQP